MKKLTLVHAACLLACSASLSVAQAQSGSPASLVDTPEIIVTASRSEQVLQTAPVGATVITRAQIESAGVLDANEAIRKIGGVAAKSDLYGGREHKLDLRGFGEAADSNLVVLVDGIRISENELAPAKLSAIAASTIERIEIIHGGSSVMWGEGAVAGVINILLRKDKVNGVAGSASFGLESFGGHDGNVHLRIGKLTSALDIHARSSGTSGYRDNSNGKQDMASIGFQADEGALKLRARLESDNSTNRWPGALSFDEFLANPRQTKKPLEWGSLKQTKASAGLDYKINRELALTLDVGAKQRESKSFFNSSGLGATTTHSTQFSPRALFKGMTGAAQLNAVVGLDINRWRSKNDNASDPIDYSSVVRDGVQNNRAMFAMTDWLLPTQTRVVLGYRSESFNKSAQDTGGNATLTQLDNKVSAHELSFNQTVQQGVDLYARFATSYRLANIDEFAFKATGATLRPQTSKDKELGAKWRASATSLQARYFVQDTVDEFIYDAALGGNANATDPTRRSGIELQVSSAVSNNVKLSGTLQSMRAIYVTGANAGKHIPLVNEQSATLRANYQIDAKQSIETAWRLLGASYFSGDDSNSCGKQIPSNRVLDASYRWLDKGWQLALGVTNLSNQKTYNFAYSCTTGSLYPELPRALRATMKYNF